MRLNHVQKVAILAVSVVVFVVLLLCMRTAPQLDVTAKPGTAKPLTPDGVADQLLGFAGKRSNEQLELARQLNDLTKKMVDDQAKKINQLEEGRIHMEKELEQLRKPADYLSMREKLAYIHPYDCSVRFPAYMWQSWRYGLNDERFGQLYKQGEEQWADLNPGFVHEIFNDDTAKAFVHYLYKDVPDVVKAYDKLPAVALKMDFFRYLMLFAKGGVWADIDTHPVKPIPNWIPDNVKPSELGMIIGVDADKAGESADEWSRKRARKLQFSNAIIQSKPGHPILRDVIAEITKRTLNEQDMTLPEEGRDVAIQKWTGEGIWTDTVLKYFNDWLLSQVFTEVTWKDFVSLENPKLVSDVLVVPKESFESDPTKYEGENAEKPGPLVFVLHRKAKVYEQR